MSPSMWLLVAGGALLIVALVGLLVFMRRREATKGQDKVREGELVQELAAIAANEDKDAAVAAAPTPEAAAAVEMAAAAEAPKTEGAVTTPDLAAEATSALSLTASPTPVVAPLSSGEVPVPDATAPVEETVIDEPVAEESASEEPVVEEPVSEEPVVAEPVAAPVVEEPVAVDPEPEPLPEPAPVPTFFQAPAPEPQVAALAPQAPVFTAPAPIFEPPAAPVVELKPEPTTETGRAAAEVAARLRAMAEAVEREARSSDDGFRVFDVVLDGFANLPVGTLLPEDEAVAAHSAFTPPSAVSTLHS